MVFLYFKEAGIWKQDGRVPINHYGASSGSRQETSTQLVIVVVTSHWQRQGVLIPVFLSSKIKDLQVLSAVGHLRKCDEHFCGKYGRVCGLH